MPLTEELLRSLLVEIYGTPKVTVPLFDIEAKTVTRGEAVDTKEVK